MVSLRIGEPTAPSARATRIAEKY